MDLLTDSKGPDAQADLDLRGLYILNIRFRMAQFMWSLISLFFLDTSISWNWLRDE